MTTPPLRLLVVDDSALMRRHLATLFESEGGFQVQQARNGREAIEMNLSFLPDVVTLDVNMPELDGLTALAEMMLARPVPVVMVSSLTEAGALTTLEALNLGAVDFVAKPGGTISLSLDAVHAEIVTKVKSAAKARLRAQRPAPHPPTAPVTVKAPTASRSAPREGVGVVLVGVSTGGPRTLEEILPALPLDFPWAIVVAQHMPASFTRPFAERLDTVCQLAVVEVTRPQAVEPGTIYVAKGGADLVFAQRNHAVHVVPKPQSQEHVWHPSVDLMGWTALDCYRPDQLIGVLLTGMGYDGAAAFTEIRRRGGRTVAESQETAVVYGMPHELIERGGASMVLPANRIAAQLQTWLHTRGNHAVRPRAVSSD